MNSIVTKSIIGFALIGAVTVYAVSRRSSSPPPRRVTYHDVQGPFDMLKPRPYFNLSWAGEFGMAMMEPPVLITDVPPSGEFVYVDLRIGGRVPGAMPSTNSFTTPDRLSSHLSSRNSPSAVKATVPQYHKTILTTGETVAIHQRIREQVGSDGKPCFKMVRYEVLEGVAIIATDFR